MFSNIRNYLNAKDYNINVTKNLLYINNYDKINIIDSNKIIISFTDFILLVDGSNISINRLLETEVLFNGCIEKVKFEYK